MSSRTLPERVQQAPSHKQEKSLLSSSIRIRKLIKEFKLNFSIISSIFISKKYNHELIIVKKKNGRSIAKKIKKESKEYNTTLLKPASFDSTGDNITPSDQSPTFNSQSSSNAFSVYYRLYLNDNQINGNIYNTTYTIQEADKLTDSVYNWYVKAFDIAGNIVQSSGSLSVTIDTISPSSFNVNDGSLYTNNTKSSKIIYI